MAQEDNAPVTQPDQGEGRPVRRKDGSQPVGVKSDLLLFFFDALADAHLLPQVQQGGLMKKKPRATREVHHADNKSLRRPAQGDPL